MNQESVRNQLTNANKLIFVKAYDEAREILDSLIRTPAGTMDLLVHLRRVELAQMLGSTANLRDSTVDVFRALHPEKNTHHQSHDPELLEKTLDIALAMIDQLTGATQPAESLQKFQSLLGNSVVHAAVHYGIAFALEGLGNLDRATWHYEKCIQIDTQWYPAYFALSQIHYQKNNESKGDENFFQFEQAAPYNVYGNFETHRKLFMEFFDAEDFEKATQAIGSLTAWWRENRGRIPDEILAYEAFSMARIAQANGLMDSFKTNSASATSIVQRMLDNKEIEESTLYFVARTAEEFNEPELALDVYRTILKRHNCNPRLVQRIGGQFLSAGEPELACELFEEAYRESPDSHEIRFCLLVGRLKKSGVNVEEYLISRERLKQIGKEDGDKVETLALLHNLMAKFQQDPDVLEQVADLYLRMGHTAKAREYFERLYSLDGLSRKTAIKYAGYKIQHGDPDEAMAILERLTSKSARESLVTVGANPVDVPGNQIDDSHDQPEIYWLKANYYARKLNFKASTAILKQAIAQDPWNISYLLQLCINLQETSAITDERMDSITDATEINRDPALVALSAGNESDIDWNDFDSRTVMAEKVHGYELAYARRKIRFLYSSGSDSCLIDLIRTACRNDPSLATYEIMRLLNTNYDSPALYWSMALLFKELWQLETASMWLEQALLNPKLDRLTKRRSLLELADCYIWRNINLKKAIEFAKLAIELGERANGRAITVLAHAYLKMGNIRQAQIYLEQVDQDRDIEATFLQGLIHYRNGARTNANKVWKPLITIRSESLRFHNIKQEILKFYFEGSPYLKPEGRNVS